MTIESRYTELDQQQAAASTAMEVSITVKPETSDAARTDLLDSRAERMAEADGRHVVGVGPVTLKGNVLTRTYYTEKDKSA